MSIPADLRRLVEIRADYCCEYCFLTQESQPWQHHVDHIRARKHGGATKAGNLALSCAACNWAKGSDVGSFDPKTDNFEFFFSPRTQIWREHFRLHTAEILPLTPVGRATARIFQFNTTAKLLERAELLRFGLYIIPNN